ncbi:MAG: histidinol-phosphatase, partial [Gammaproteobacteria bacterium]|nr:histidinol-phosphatase [Gammaproteobacteria bacterium]
MEHTPYLFIDRDGTLVQEPPDEQVDSLDKIRLVPGVIPALLKLRDAGYRFVMVSNQDGLGSSTFPLEQYQLAQTFILDLFRSQGISFADVQICPHRPEDHCDCRKPKTGLVQSYLDQPGFDRQRSAVIGDRATDAGLASNMGIASFMIDDDDSWD